MTGLIIEHDHGVITNENVWSNSSRLSLEDQSESKGRTKNILRIGAELLTATDYQPTTTDY